MNTLDYIILAILGVGFVAGFMKGVIQQAFSLGGLILGIILGTLLYRPFAGFLLDIFNMSDQAARIVAFIVILLVVPILFGLVGKLLSKLIQLASLGFIDRLAGGVFGLFKVLIIIGLIIKLGNMTGVTENIIDYEDRKESRLFEPVETFTGKCLQWTWSKVQDTAWDLIPEIPVDEEQSKNDEKQKV